MDALRNALARWQLRDADLPHTFVLTDTFVQ
jgi:hypothetical protein